MFSHLIRNTEKLKIRDFVVIFLLKAVVDISAYYVLADNFQPYTLQFDFNLYKLIESNVLMFIVVLFLPTDISRVSTIGVWMLVLISYLPLLTVFSISNSAREWAYACTFFWILVCLLLKFLPRVTGFPVLKNGKYVFYILLSAIYILALFIAALLLKSSGFEINFNLNEVYEARTRYVETAGSFDGYILNAAALVINPLILGLGLVNRRKSLMLLSLASQVILFGVTGFKFYLFSLPLICFIYFVYENNLKISVFAVALFFLAVASVTSFFVYDDIWLSSLFVNRLLILPAVISYYHYDFFLVNEPIYLAQSILSFLVDSPYSELSNSMISDIYFSAPLSMANTGILGDAYMNFKFPGLLGLAIVFAATLILADGLSYKKNIILAASIFCMPVLFLVNVAFLGVFLTGGMALSFVLTFLLPKKEFI